MAVLDAVRARTAEAAPERGALVVWVVSRVLTLVVPVLVAVLALGREAHWQHWDVVHFQQIATGGYAQESTTPYPAFFPLLPLLLRVLGGLGLDLTAAGVALSAVAGAVAVLALCRLARLEGRPEAGPRAVLLLVTSPSAVFLVAGYTEALFLALALPAWLAARRERWWLAGTLTAAAAGVRVTGIFLAVALAVEWATRARQRRWQDLGALALPLVPVLAFTAYLRVATGDWLAWVNAQQQGWRREPTAPWDAWGLTWKAAFEGWSTPSDAAIFRMELAAVLVGVAVTVWLVLARRWGEATFVGLQVAALATSTWFFSVPRATLLWWPLWLVLARLTLGRPWLLALWLLLSLPLALYLAVRFVTGLWAG